MAAVFSGNNNSIMFFLEKIGRITTCDTKWIIQPPSLEKITRIINHALGQTDDLGLELHIMGQCLIDAGKTKDLDLFVTGDIEDQTLENLLHELVDYSLNQEKVLLDMSWSSLTQPVEQNAEGVYSFKEHTLKVLNPWQWRQVNYTNDIEIIIQDIHTKQTCRQLTEFMVEIPVNPIVLKKYKHLAGLRKNPLYFGTNAREWLNTQ